MRRTSTAHTSSLVASTGGEQGFWPSYADMMSAVALILFFLMLLAYIENIITGNNLQNTQEELETTQSQLSTTQSDLEDTQYQLSDTQASLEITMKQVEQAENELNKISIDLDEAQTTLSEKEKEIAAQDAALADQKALIGEQEEYMKAANEELLAMRSQMQTIAVLRLSILEQIRDSLVEVMGDSAKVSISDNGNIVLSESILFDVGSSEVKSEAKPALTQLSKVFAQFLASDENAQYVDSIVISGHTDSTGNDEDNRVLSTDRANAVLNYLLDANYGQLDSYKQYFCAAGYGASRPVESNDTVEGRSANRRIEISITLKDDTVMDIIDSYLDMDVPDVGTDTAESADTTAAVAASSSTAKS